MKRTLFLKKLEHIPLITHNIVLIVGEELRVSKPTLNTFVSRSIKYGDLISLKQGVYVTRKFYEQNASNIGYKFFVASKLIEPSYISLETALYFYGLITNTVNNTFTSISRKRSVKIFNKMGMFVYKSIKNPLFTGFRVLDINGFNVLIAEPYKAVFDYVYYNLPKKELRNVDAVFEYLDLARIDIDMLGKSQENKLIKLLKSV